MNCKYLKIKLNKKFECKKTKKIINIKECINCKNKEYKSNNHQIKKKSSKLAKLEKSRYSVFTDDLEHCIICGKRKDHIHEIFFGAYRQRSIKEHMVLPLCTYHHTQIHKDIELSLYWKRSCQKEFEKSHTREEFIKTFGKSYIK